MCVGHGAAARISTRLRNPRFHVRVDELSKAICVTALNRHPIDAVSPREIHICFRFLFRFGDQILQIDGVTVAGWKLSKVHDHLRKKTDPKNIRLVVRDRPFDRTITLQKDSAGRIGFVINVRLPWVLGWIEAFDILVWD